MIKDKNTLPLFPGFACFQPVNSFSVTQFKRKYINIIYFSKYIHIFFGEDFTKLVICCIIVFKAFYILVTRSIPFLFYPAHFPILSGALSCLYNRMRLGCSKLCSRNRYLCKKNVFQFSELCREYIGKHATVLHIQDGKILHGLGKELKSLEEVMEGK